MAATASRNALVMLERVGELIGFLRAHAETTLDRNARSLLQVKIKEGDDADGSSSN